MPTVNIKLEPEQILIQHEWMKKYRPIEFNFAENDSKQKYR